MRAFATTLRILLLLSVSILIQGSSAEAAKKVVFGWITFQDTKWPAPYSGGNIPADSLPWESLTHVGLFAANGSQPPQSYYVNQYGAFTAKAHSKGAFAGITVGGSGDAALVTMVAGGAATWVPWIKTYLAYVDQHKMDFIDFDFEGSYSAANIGGFFSVLYDSLQTRWSGNDPTRHPFIVLTASVSHAISWNTQIIRDRVEIVNLMTYDYNNDAWGRVTFDNSPKSYKWYNGTGGATDSVGSGTNAIAPSMQRMAIRVSAAGWPKEKLTVGLDVNGGSWNGAIVPRQSTSGVSDGGSDATFAGLWPTLSQLPRDSVFFDQIAQAYWFRTGGDLWTLLTLPGRDSGMIATRKVVDSMGIGGVCIWNLGNEGWNASPTPPGGKGWFFSQIRQHLNFNGSTPPPPPPPPDTTAPSVAFVRPANNDSLSGTVTLEASASDNAGVNRVQFLLDGANLGSADFTAPFTYSWNTDPVADGNHTISAVAYDNAGLSARRDITVRLVSPPPPPPPPPDTIAPTVAFTNPANGSSFYGTVTLQANAGDNVGVASVQFLLDGASLGSDNAAPYQLSWNSDPVADGPHTLSAVARDAAGLQARADISITLTSPAPDTTPGGSTDTIAVYRDAVASPYISGSWGSAITWQSTQRTFSGNSAIKAVQNAWGAVDLHSGSWSSPVPVDVSSGDQLRFSVYPETTLTLLVELHNDFGETFGARQINQIPAGRWSTFTIPVVDLNPEGHVVHEVSVQNYVAKTVTYHLDDLVFVTAGDTSNPGGGGDTTSSGPLAAPVLVAPSNGELGTSDTPTLSWQPLASGASAQYQVATDSAFTQIVASNAGVTGGSVTLAALQNGVKHWWRVRAASATETSPWSATFTFTTTTLTVSLKYDRLFVDFGEVGIGDEKPDSVTIVNDNDVPVVITNVRTTSSRFTARMSGSTIPAKGRQKLYLGFKPDRRSTETDIVISIAGTVTRTDTVRLRGTGAKKSRGRFSRGRIVVRPGGTEEAVDSFYVSNDGDLPLNLTSVKATTSEIQVTPSTAVIGSYSSQLFEVTVKPKNHGKKVKGYIVIEAENVPVDSISVEMDTPAGTVPDGYVLSQNYPNPFNPETRIAFSVPTNSQVKLTIFNVSGQEVTVLVDGIQAAGTVEAIWNGKNAHNEYMPSGVYYYRMVAVDASGSGEATTITRRMLLVK